MRYGTRQGRSAFDRSTRQCEYPPEHASPAPNCAPASPAAAAFAAGVAIAAANTAATAAAGHPRYYRGAAGAVIVYDVTDPASFKNAKGWYTQLKMMGEQGVQVALVGNKADLDKRKVPEEEADEFAQQVRPPARACGRPSVPLQLQFTAVRC